MRIGVVPSPASLTQPLQHSSFRDRFVQSNRDEDSDEASGKRVIGKGTTTKGEKERVDSRE